MNFDEILEIARSADKRADTRVSAEASSALATMVATFRETLRFQGYPDDEAEALTRQFMANWIDAITKGKQ